MLRLIRALWSLLWLVVFLVGLPAVLVGYVGWPLPDHSPTRDDWQRWAAQPLTRTSIIDTAAIIAWLMWAMLVYAVILEIRTRTRRVAGWLRGRQLPPLPTPMQATASGMLGAAVFGMPTGTAQPVTGQPVAPASPAQPVAAQPVAAQPAVAPILPATASPAVPADRFAVPSVMDAHPTLGECDPGPNRQRGVTLPDGGWVTDHTAQAIASAAAVVWWHRRRAYQPRPPVGAARTDPDLAPLPPTVTTIQDVLRSREHPDDNAPDPDDATGKPAPATPQPTAVLQTGAPAGRPIQPGDLPFGGVGLTGIGALAAARGILTAVLLSRGPWRHPGQAHLVTTAADLDTLLGQAAADHHTIPGLTVAASLDDAIALVEQQIITRGRLMAADRAAADHRAPHAVGFPPLVVLTRGPSDPATATRLAVLLAGIHLGVTGALLGGWPHGATWWVDDDGYTQSAGNTAGTGARLCVLTPTATADLLTLLGEARTGDGHRPPPPASPTPQLGPSNLSAGVGKPGGASATPRPHAPATHAGAPAAPPATPAPLRLRLLGTPTLYRSGDAGEQVPIQRSAALQILVMLAVHRRGATSNQLIAALWPGPRPERATDRLYTPVSKLRVALREAAAAEVLVRAGDRYRLDDHHIDVDLWQLHAAVDEAATAIDPAERRRALRAVIDAYTGELAADTDWTWLAPHREAARRHVVDAYVTLAATEPDPYAALALLQDALRTDPMNEDLRLRALRAYATAGDPPPSGHLPASEGTGSQSDSR